MTADNLSTDEDSSLTCNTRTAHDSCVAQFTETVPFDAPWNDDFAVREVKSEFPDVACVKDEYCIDIKEELEDLYEECVTSAVDVSFCLQSNFYIYCNCRCMVRGDHDVYCFYFMSFTVFLSIVDHTNRGYFGNRFLVEGFSKQDKVLQIYRGGLAIRHHIGVPLGRQK